MAFFLFIQKIIKKKNGDRNKAEKIRQKGQGKYPEEMKSKQKFG